MYVELNEFIYTELKDDILLNEGVSIFNKRIPQNHRGNAVRFTLELQDAVDTKTMNENSLTAAVEQINCQIDVYCKSLGRSIELAQIIRSNFRFEKSFTDMNISGGKLVGGIQNIYEDDVDMHRQMLEFSIRLTHKAIT